MNIKVKCEQELNIHDINYELELPIYYMNLNNIRNKIDKIEQDNWKKVRWCINNYDFLVKPPVINRAFYKFWEILHEYDLFKEYTKEDIIYHGAEAPGGFIQCTNIYLDLNKLQKHQKTVDEDGFVSIIKTNIKKVVYTMSLNNNLAKFRHYNLPGYNSKILNSSIYVYNGKDNTGDIKNIDNILDLKTKMNGKQCHLITCDGGFDEKDEYNNKEQLHSLLILSSILNALYLQKDKGHFVLKMFDIFTETSIHLLYLLNDLYDEIYVYKPKTSRPSNSEKYIICKYFNESKRNKYIDKFEKAEFKMNEKYGSFRLYDNISKEFLENINKMNQDFIYNQCFFLEKAITLCNNPDFFKYYDKEINNLINKRKEYYELWAKQYNLSLV